MRLLRIFDDETFAFEEYFDLKQTPPYAILSHTWGAEEITYQDIGDLEHARTKAGYQKIDNFCRIVQEEYPHLNHVWVDTCCIDKSSSAELSEAINSMFRWYQSADICVAYLADVHLTRWQKGFESQFAASRWFTRGWTLQELIAPNAVHFYTSDWVYIAAKTDTALLISDITNIDIAIIRDPNHVLTRSVAQRMSWAARRCTTRQEDIAYCLLGIFDVNMPLLYGEGAKAFIRLQEEIMKDSNDHTLFAWQEDDSVDSGEIVQHLDYYLSGLLATSPAQFAKAAYIAPYRRARSSSTYSMTNQGLCIDLPLVVEDSSGLTIALLECIRGADPAIDEHTMLPERLGLYLRPTGLAQDGHYARCRRHPMYGNLVATTKEHESKAKSRTIYVRKKIQVSEFNHILRRDGIYIRQKPHPRSGFSLYEVHPKEQWAPKDDMIYAPVRDAFITFVVAPNVWISRVVRVTIVIQVEDAKQSDRAENNLYSGGCAIVIKSPGESADIASIRAHQKKYTPKTFVDLVDGRRMIVEISKGMLLGEEMFFLDIDVVSASEGLHELPGSFLPVASENALTTMNEGQRSWKDAFSRLGASTSKLKPTKSPTPSFRRLS